MLTRVSRRVVEEEVTEVVGDDSIVALIEREEREERERMKYERNRLDSFPSFWIKISSVGRQCRTASR